MTHARTVLITGATDGLGRALAHRLAAGGDTVLLHGRDQGRLDATADAIRDEHGVARPATFRADLAELAQVRELAAAVRDATERLDVLVSNAGIGGGEPDGRDRRESKDGYELRFAVNYLAGFLLTQELLPLLRASAPARVVNVASLGQQEIEFGDVMLEHGYSGMRAYCQSKLAQIASAVELASACRPRGHVQQPAPGDVHADEDGAPGSRAQRRQPGDRGRGDVATGDRPEAGRGQRAVLRPAAGVAGVEAGV